MDNIKEKHLIFNTNYLSSNLKTDKRVIIDNSMTGTQHGVLNVISLLNMCNNNNSKILCIIPIGMIHHYISILKNWEILLNNTIYGHQIKDITVINKKEDYHFLSNPTSKITFINNHKLFSYKKNNNVISSEFDHFLLKGDFPNINSKFHPVFLDIIMDSKKIIFDCMPFRNELSFISFSNILDKIGEKSFPMKDIFKANCVHVNEELSFGKLNFLS